MRLILKLIATPFIVLLTILVAVLLFLFSVSSFLLTAASVIMALLGVGLFWLLLVIMVSSGATELAVSQWASTLAESGLGVSKTVGDLAGPCLFSVFMGLGRILGARFDDSARLRVMTGAGVLCVLSYLLIALAPIPALSLAGCALCGFAVSVSWPMTLGLAAQAMPQGGMDALLNKNPLDILAYQYDIVCNGIELSSGAIRNHQPEVMYKAFEIAGYDRSVVDDKFGGMINAFKLGAPPHGGIAPGVDRMVMLLADEPNIREVIAFPFNQQAQDLMMNAPAEVSIKQLRELHIEVKLPKKQEKPVAEAN